MIKNQLDYLDFRAKKLFYNENDIYQNWSSNQSHNPVHTPPFMLI